jgi:hypothetical protein
MGVGMDLVEARRFAAEWERDWNAHDLDALLAHYRDDVAFTSPAAARLIAGSGGVIRGKAALRAYFAEGLRRIPGLRFEVLDLFVGVATLVIEYRNQDGGRVAEVLVFDGGLVAGGHGTYLDG